jgi:hypothetical protein
MKRQIIVIMTLLILVFLNLYSQVSMVPMAAYIDPDTHTGSMQVVNPTNEIKEVDISFRFGYTAFDSLGNAFTNFNDSALEKKYSLAPYIKVFPEKLVIPPNEKQTIRFFVRNLPDNKDVKDQILWTKIVAGSVTASPQVDSSKGNNVQVNFAYRIEMVGLVAFIKGANNSRLEYKLLGTSADSLYINLLLENDKIGEIPYWGSLRTEIYDSSDKLVGRSTEYLAIYFSGRQRIKFYREGLPPGKYKAKFSYTNEREEVPEQYRPVFVPESKEFDFEVK